VRMAVRVAAVCVGVDGGVGVGGSSDREGGRRATVREGGERRLRRGAGGWG
jgi:hypothetical protein